MRTMGCSAVAIRPSSSSAVSSARSWGLARVVAPEEKRREPLLVCSPQALASMAAAASRVGTHCWHGSNAQTWITATTWSRTIAGTAATWIARAGRGGADIGAPSTVRSLREVIPTASPLYGRRNRTGRLSQGKRSMGTRIPTRRSLGGRRLPPPAIRGDWTATTTA